MFLKRQVLVKLSEVLTVVPSGTLISTTKAARLHAESVVAVSILLGVKVAVLEGFRVGVLLGVKVGV
jgi:hypothetical protein